MPDDAESYAGAESPSERQGSPSSRELERGRRPAEPAFARGERVASRYEVEGWIGWSDEAELYRVIDHELHEVVALKAVQPSKPNDPALRRLLTEARQLRRIRHPTVCRVHDVGIHCPADGSLPTYFSTSPLIDGWRLSRVLRTGTLAPPVALGLCRQLLEGLEEAHRVGVQHCRLGSSRLLIGGAAGQPKVHIIEFGGSEQGEPSSVGERQQGVALDLQGVGLVLLEMLTGPLAPAASATELVAMERQLAAPVRARLPRLPAWLAEVVQRCLHGASSRGYRNARAVLQALAARSAE